VTAEYVELHCHSYYSLLDGASSPEALVERAASLGYPALALTDHDGLYGAVRFWRAARERGLKPIIGAEVSVQIPPTGDSPPRAADPGRAWEESATGGADHLLLLAQDQRGYANLSRLISRAHLALPGKAGSCEDRPGGAGPPTLSLEDLSAHAAGLVCLSGCRRGSVPRALLAGNAAGARRTAGRLGEIFRGRFWLEVQRHYLPDDGRLAARLAALARELGIGLAATNDVHYATREGQPLHDVLTCIRNHATLPQALAGGLLHPNSERFLKSPREMAALFDSLPQAICNTLAIAQQCNVSLDFSGQRLPAFPVPEGHTPASYLRSLCELGLGRRFDPITAQARAQMDHELAVIDGMGLAGYFLVVWDIVRFAREGGIRCQGRGSAANSLVAYLLEITPVDPLRYNLLFERFLSGAAHTMPDIDVDFAADGREAVIQYVYERYGQEHVGMVCNVVTYRARLARREAAKSLAFPPDILDHLPDPESLLPTPESPTPGSQGPDLPWQLLSNLVQQMQGVPRHLSIHVGGMLITAAPLVEIVPLERATMPGRVVVQWDKDGVEDAGLIKIDLLSLRTLGAVEEARRHVAALRGIELDLDHLPMDDPAVYRMLQRADTVGCFQVESRAQAQMLPRLLPTRFEDIVVGVALIRPGPLQGGMVHPYLRRRQAAQLGLSPSAAGAEPVTYAHPSLEPILAETLGVIIFQEQVIRVAMAIAGLSPAEADELRRALGRSRSEEALIALQERFLKGALANGVARAAAEEVWQQVQGFAGFGFCKSHAAAFALVSYQTLYLKAHFPAEFFCALLNHQPMGFYPVEVLVGDARRHGVAVLHPDVNLSQVDCILEPSASPGARALPTAEQAPSTAEQAPPTAERAPMPAAWLPTAEQAPTPAAWLPTAEQAPPTAERAPMPAAWSIRLGLRYVHGLGEAWQSRVVERRQASPFRDLGDFCRRTRLPRAVVENLIRAGAMDHLDRSRRDLLWQLGGLVYSVEGLDIEVPLEAVDLPDLGRAERLSWEYELLGLAPGDQVMGLYREALQAHGLLTSRELEARSDGEWVRVAGWAVVRQRPPTAKGHLFVTLEDEEGLINLIVRPHVYERYRDPLRSAPLLWIEGRLQRQGAALSVLVDRVAALGA
jgi:error-prone DNA polymerase